MADDLALTRFANNEIHQNVSETNVVVNLRFVLGKRVATVSTGRIDDAGLAARVERAAAIARTVEELEDWAGLPARSDGRGLAAGYAEATAEASPELRAEGARAVIAAAEERRRPRLRLLHHVPRGDRGGELVRDPAARDADRRPSS